MAKAASGGVAVSLQFQTIIKQFGNNTGIEVPEPIVAKLNAGQRPLVRVTVNGYKYRSSIAKMDGKFMISLSAANREAAGVQGGDDVEVTVALDTEVRTVEIPDDLRAALTAANELDAFDNSAPSMKKEYVRQVEEAKKPETRERRIAKIVEKLSAA
jgi:antitoxin component of MazEF toxin-antitoxin module